MKYLLALIALICLISPVLADNVTANATPIRISQGDSVYLGETVDISAVAGWAEYFAYTDGYNAPSDDSTTQTIKTPDTKEGYYNFYIDPAIFKDRLGLWYTWYGHYEPAGNMLAFNVLAGTRPVTLPTNIGNTTGNITGGAGNITITTPNILPTVLPDVHVADYLVARGDPFTVDTIGGGKVWLFGTESNLYDVESPGDNVTITSEQTRGLIPGKYQLLIQTPGKNGQFDVRYNDNALQYKNDWDGINGVSIHGLQPLLVVGLLQDVIGKTDDRYIVLSLEVGYPAITIESMYETEKNPIESFNFNVSGTVTWFDVKGYSNYANETQLNAYLDRDQHPGKALKQYTFATKTIRTGPGNKSQFEVFVPIDWDNLEIGMHTISVVGPDGAITNADFPVNIMPADSYRPNATLKYAGDRNPWVPPVVINNTITVEVTKEIVKEVIKEVPPPQESVDAAQKKAVDEAIAFYGLLVLWVGGLLTVGMYLFNVYRRAKRL